MKWNFNYIWPFSPYTLRRAAFCPPKTAWSSSPWFSSASRTRSWSWCHIIVLTMSISDIGPMLRTCMFTSINREGPNIQDIKPIYATNTSLPPKSGLRLLSYSCSRLSSSLDTLYAVWLAMLATSVRLLPTNWLELVRLKQKRQNNYPGIIYPYVVLYITTYEP